MVRTCHFNCQDPASIPRVGTKIPTSGIVQPKKKKKVRQIKTNTYDISYVWNLKTQQTSEYNKKEADARIQRTD